MELGDSLLGNVRLGNSHSHKRRLVDLLEPANDLRPRIRLHNGLGRLLLLSLRTTYLRLIVELFRDLLKRSHFVLRGNKCVWLRLVISLEDFCGLNTAHLSLLLRLPALLCRVLASLQKLLASLQGLLVLSSFLLLLLLLKNFVRLLFGLLPELLLLSLP